MIPVVGLAVPWLMKDPKRVKYALVGIGMLAALWSFRVWLVARDERAAAQAKIKLVEQQTEERSKALDAREAGLQLKQEALNAREAEIDAQRTVLGKSRLSIKSDLASGLEGLRSELARTQGEASSVPADALDERIRGELAALR